MSVFTRGTYLRIIALSFGVSLLACANPQPGPDKSIGGAILGAGWGAGAGAVIGNQTTDSPGKAVAVGAGFGAAGGLLMGMGYDLEESVQLEQNRELAALKVQSAANQMELAKLQAYLDHPAPQNPVGAGVYTVHFDEDQTNLRLGSVKGLEQVAEAIKGYHGYRNVYVAGHTDDTGRPDYNEKLAKARADSVAAYLAARGIPTDYIKVESFSASRPVATNKTAAGRQLNRRTEVSLVR
jgi:outer membrane protein OmpA-like peptidoglycan-associated protein